MLGSPARLNGMDWKQDAAVVSEDWWVGPRNSPVGDTSAHEGDGVCIGGPCMGWRGELSMHPELPRVSESFA